MMPYAVPLIFAALLEYQAIVSPGAYSIITAVGLIGLMVLYTASDKGKINIPISLLFLFSFLLSVPLSFSMAFQSMLILSTIILYDVLNKNSKWALEIKNGKLSKDELRHLLFHSWLKYWNFFIGIWFILSLHTNSTLSETQYAFLLFTFIIVYLTVLLTDLGVFKLKDMICVLTAAVLMVGFDAILRQTLGEGFPHYIQAALIVIAFDFGDTWFHRHNFHETSRVFWTRKIVLYSLWTLYIVQIHLMMSTPIFSLQEVYKTLSLKQNASETYSSVLGDAKMPEAKSTPTVVAPDDANFSSHHR